MNFKDRSTKELKIQYFDTIPVARSLLILKAGFLFAASEFGNQLSSFLFVLFPVFPQESG